MALTAQLKEIAPRWAKDVGDVTTRGYAVGTAVNRPMPDFLIIGCKRGGTTSLFNYLLMHPGVLGLFPQVRGKKSTDYFFKEAQRGPRWYRSHFHTETYRVLKAKQLGYRAVSGEASPYYLWDYRVAEQVKALNPNTKAIALLRDPVKRAHSHYAERVINGVEPLSFEAALAAEDDRLHGESHRMAEDPHYYSAAHDFYSYRARGVYLPQILNWHRSFPKEQLLVLRSEDLYADVQGTFDTVCRFLNIPLFTLPNTAAFNASAPAPMAASTQAALQTFYQPHNRDLADYLGTAPLWP